MMLTYKGYTAHIKIDPEAETICGQVVDIKDVVTFEGKTVKEAKREFYKSIDTYLAFCEELGQKPDKPFSGKVAFRTTPDTHRAIYLAATEAGKSINAWMEETLRESAERAVTRTTNQNPQLSSEKSGQAKRQRLNQTYQTIDRLRDAVKPYLKTDEGDTFNLFLATGGMLLKELDAVQPYLKNQEPDTIVQFITAIVPFVKNKELMATEQEEAVEDSLWGWAGELLEPEDLIGDTEDMPGYVTES